MVQNINALCGISQVLNKIFCLVIFQKDPRVLDAMLPYNISYYGNPHSRTHAYGWETEEAVEKARKVILFFHIISRGGARGGGAGNVSPPSGKNFVSVREFSTENCVQMHRMIPSMLLFSPLAGEPSPLLDNPGASPDNVFAISMKYLFNIQCSKYSILTQFQYTSF